METSEKTNSKYYTNLPAEVRYDHRLSANAKLLFSEIKALSSKTGKCWASNNYFASLYQVDRRTIIRWINNLKEFGYINTINIREQGKKEIKERIITLKKSAKQLIGSDNNITKVVTTMSAGSDNNVARVVTNLSEGSDPDVTENIKHNNKENTIQNSESEIINHNSNHSKTENNLDDLFEDIVPIYDNDLDKYFDNHLFMTFWENATRHPSWVDKRELINIPQHERQYNDSFKLFTHIKKIVDDKVKVFQ